MSVTAVPLRPIKKGSVAKLWSALLLLALAAAALAWWTSGHHRFTRTASGLGFQVVKEGEGPTPGPKDMVVLNYIGRLANGTVFDSNTSPQGVPFPVDENATVKGFAEGLKMMRTGGVYRLRIPPKLGYGSRNMGQIPPNSTLDFDIAVRRIMSEAEVRQMMQQQMLMQQLQGGGRGQGGAPAGGGGGAGAAQDAGPDATGPDTTGGAAQAEPPQGR
jgi:FKBP-type peptidyl-prolyl cis-trans isomerase FkpA